jgi:malonate decarboxylase beta subunit
VSTEAESGAAMPRDYRRFLERRSFIEMSGRERARAILDAGSFREVLGPFDRLKSPWLPLQGIVAQADDGVVLARGTLDGKPALVAAIESAFQGGSTGEVSGAKIAGALELACRDWEQGRPVLPVLLLETGGVRLQEANLGLAAIAEIHAAIVALRRHVPVVGVVAGMVGCFGGMSLAAALCSRLIVTRQARLGMNGPEVIEQEAGTVELDASDRPLIWSLIGGEQRRKAGLADDLLEDDADAIAAGVRDAFARGAGATPRTAQVERFMERLAAIDPQQPLDSQAARALGMDATSTESQVSRRGRVWFETLTEGKGRIAHTLRSVLIADAALGGETARFIAVVPNAQNRFPRARGGEVGIDEAWALALHVREAIAADRDGARRPIIAVVDVSGQAYGRREELLGIHLACAAAADAYATARLAGHPVIALLVGKAMSGAFLAHGYQANRIIALDSPEVMVHAMGKQAAARVTRRSVAELEMLGKTLAPMAYDIRSFARLGLLHKLIEGVNADAPGPSDAECVRAELLNAIAATRAGARGLENRLASPAARESRAASIEVRRRLAEQWDAP